MRRCIEIQSSANYPGGQLANRLSKVWQESWMNILWIKTTFHCEDPFVRTTHTSSVNLLLINF